MEAVNVVLVCRVREALFLLLYQTMFGLWFWPCHMTSGERLPWNDVEGRETPSKWQLFPFAPIFIDLEACQHGQQRLAGRPMGFKL
jgi:hypothetical protein